MCNVRLQKLKFRYFIDGITINFLFFENFANMNDIKRKLYYSQKFLF